MKQLTTGQFHGQTNVTMLVNGLTLTDTEYTQDKVDWHYHENAYFTFILQGNVIEGNKEEIYTCSAGSLLFHHWQEPHYNIKPPGFTRGFHIELENNWLNNLKLDISNLTGSRNLQSEDIKLLFYKIVKESKINDETAVMAIESLLAQVLGQMSNDNVMRNKKNPRWVLQIRELLNDSFTEKISLSAISETLDIHPAHLSRDFSKHYNCTLGTYIRNLKVQRALALLPKKNISLSAISFECGFADQSHFNRCFKGIMGVTPFTYRKLIIG